MFDFPIKTSRVTVGINYRARFSFVANRCLTLISIHRVGNEAIGCKRHSLDWQQARLCLLLNQLTKPRKERNLIKNLVPSASVCVCKVVVSLSRTSGLSIVIRLNVADLMLSLCHPTCVCYVCSFDSAKIKRHLMRIVNSSRETILIFNFGIMSSTRNGNALVSLSIKCARRLWFSRLTWVLFWLRVNFN